MSAFMIPVAEYLTLGKAREYTEPEEGWDGVDWEPEEGWYARLSAPGYMDCTDWTGPYPRAWQALREVCRLYEVRLDGEPRWTEEEVDQ